MTRERPSWVSVLADEILARNAARRNNATNTRRGTMISKMMDEAVWPLAKWTIIGGSIATLVVLGIVAISVA